MIQNLNELNKPNFKLILSDDPGLTVAEASRKSLVEHGKETMDLYRRLSMAKKQIYSSYFSPYKMNFKYIVRLAKEIKNQESTENC